ncbi:MAG: hypothetical protein ACLR1R_00240 [Ruminococcus callidus]
MKERKEQLSAQQQKQQQLAKQQAELPQLQAAYESSHARLERLTQELAVKTAEREQCQAGLPYASLSLAKKQLEQKQSTIRQLEQAQQQAAQKWQQQKEQVSSQQKLVQHLRKQSRTSRCMICKPQNRRWNRNAAKKNALKNAAGSPVSRHSSARPLPERYRNGIALGKAKPDRGIPWKSCTR